MTPDQLKQLRSFYHSLIGFKEQLDQATSMKQHAILRAAGEVMLSELKRLSNLYPNLAPPPDAGFSYTDTGYCFIAPLTAHLSTVISRLKFEIESFDSNPVTEKKSFPFVKSPELRSILERDYEEIQKAFVTGCWKSVIILAGGAVEAILLDRLQQYEARARASPKAPKDKAGKVQDIRDWGFVHLILVAADLELVNPGVDKHSHSLREYRDLVHPTVEIRSRLRVDAEEAKIALEVLNIVHRDLSA